MARLTIRDIAREAGVSQQQSPLPSTIAPGRIAEYPSKNS